MSEDQFWRELDFATSNPKLYDEITSFRRWIGAIGMMPDDLENGLRHYFGMSDEQVDAWMRWYFAAHFNRNDVTADMLKAHAVDLTFKEPWPGRFEMHRYSTAEEVNG